MLPSMIEQTSTSEVVIACDPNAIPAELREGWMAIGKQVYAAVLEAQALSNGYRFRLPTESVMLLQIAEYISNERLCCPFLDFGIEVTPDRGPIWLSLTGGEGVKAYIGGIFAESGLLNPAVAATIGIAI